jgi:hypothetical protein
MSGISLYYSIGSFIPPQTLEKEQEESENNDWTIVELSNEKNSTSDQKNNRNEKNSNNNSRINTLKRKERRKKDESETKADFKSKRVHEGDEKDDDEEEEEDYLSVIVADRIPSSSLSSLLSCYQEEIEGVLISVQRIHCKIGNKIYAHRLQ